MRGHLKARGENTWAIVLDVRDPQTGRRRRRWHSFKGTRREAETERSRLITELQKGTAAEPSRLTVAAFLEKWLEHIKPQVAPKTVERYAGLIHANIIPAIGAVRLSKLQPIAISGVYSAALAHLAPRTVQHMHRCLSQALKQATRWRLLPRNPCDDCDPPRIERRDMKVWDLSPPRSNWRGRGECIFRSCWR
jgi:hypothetical protein